MKPFVRAALQPVEARKPVPSVTLKDAAGRIAAAYTAGLVDREDVEANIREILR